MTENETELIKEELKIFYSQFYYFNFYAIKILLICILPSNGCTKFISEECPFKILRTKIKQQ